MARAQIGYGLRYKDQWAWCKANIDSQFPDLQICNSYTLWFWCKSPAGPKCEPTGTNPLERRDNEKFRVPMRKAFLTAPLFSESLQAAGNAVLTADNYNLNRKSFRFYVRTGKTFEAFGGSAQSSVSTSTVKTLFGERTRSMNVSAYEEAPITFEVSMDESRAREFYALALPHGCTGTDGRGCSTDNIVVDIVYSLRDYKQVATECVGADCFPRYEFVHALEGFRLRVADRIKTKGEKRSSLKPGELLVQTIYAKP